MQNITKPKALKSAFASGAGALKNDIPNNTTGTYNASFEDGFPAITMQPLALGGTPPDGKDMNGVLNVTTDYNFQFQNGFLPTFEQSVSDLIGGYPQDAILWYKDANNNVKPVVSLIGNNTYNFNTDPSYIDGVKWKEIIEKTTGRNVGEIFYTMRNDAALNGAVECDGSIYDTTDFTGAQSIGQLLLAGKVPYVSLATYATLLLTQGSVGVFGWDGVGTTDFRVPSLNDVFIETGTSAELGDYEAAGLPNITGNVDLTGESNTTTPRFNSNDIAGSALYNNVSITSGMYHTDSASGSGYNRIEIDASRSNSIYGNSTTVQPNTVRYRAMVQLAISATDEALETCTSVLADIAGLKSHEVIEFQAPTAQNNYTWYRKYRDGWVEQGGIGTSSTTITLPKAMADTNYSILFGNDYYSASAGTPVVVWYDKTSTGFCLQGRWNGSGQNGIGYSWEVKGIAAS